jgi:hypothetical protein
LPEPPEGFENHPGGAAAGQPAGDQRPDWLVGAEEGAQSEYRRDDSVEGNAPAERVIPMPELRRPAPARIGLPLESRPAPAPPAPPRAVAWSGVGNSIPRLTQESEGEVRTAFTPRNQDDDVAPLPEDDTGMLSVASTSSSSPSSARSTARPVLEEPWWVVVGERLTGDRRILFGVGAALVVVIGAFVLWPRANTSASVKEIRRHPDQWEGRSVQVSGRVGDDVFPLGSGYVFHLLQGRDTIVVFTRSRIPERRQRVNVIGEVSAGYLDGRARLAILETPPTP